jgi:hypothetical protein
LRVPTDDDNGSGAFDCNVGEGTSTAAILVGTAMDAATPVTASPLRLIGPFFSFTKYVSRAASVGINGAALVTCHKYTRAREREREC